MCIKKYFFSLNRFAKKKILLITIYLVNLTAALQTHLFLKIANTLVNLNNKTKTSNFQIISINIHSIFVLFSVWEVYLCPIIWKCYIVTKNRGNHSTDIYTQLGWLPMFEVNNRLTSYLWTSRSLQIWLIITYIRNVPDV